MKSRLSLPLVLAALLLIPSLALAASASGPQPQADPAAGPLLAALGLDTGAVPPALTPEPLFLSDPLPCGECSSQFCADKYVGEPCGISPVTRCVRGPSCTLGAVTCLCQVP